MPQRFGQPIDVPYVPQYQPLPIEAIGQTAQQLQQTYDQSLAAADELAMSLREIPTTPAGEQYKQQAISDIDEDIERLASEGDISEMPRRVRQLAREYAGDMQALQQQQQQYQDTVEQIQEADQPLRVHNWYMQQLQEGDQFEVTDDGHIRSNLQAPHIQEYFDNHEYVRTLMGDVRDDTSHAFQTEDGQWISEQELLESPQGRRIAGKMKERKFPGEGVDPDTGERGWEHSRAATSVATQLVRNPKSRQQIQLELQAMDEEEGGITDDMEDEEIQDRVYEHAINLTQTQIQARSGSDRTYSGIGTGAGAGGADERVGGVDYTYMEGWSHERRIGSVSEAKQNKLQLQTEGSDADASALEFELGQLRNKFFDKHEDYDRDTYEQVNQQINELSSQLLSDASEGKLEHPVDIDFPEGSNLAKLFSGEGAWDRAKRDLERGRTQRANGIAEHAISEVNPELYNKYQEVEGHLEDWVQEGGGITDRIVSPMADGADEIMNELERIEGRSFRIGPNSFNSDVSEIETDADLPDDPEQMGAAIFDQFADRMEFTGFVSPNHTNDLQLQFSFKDDGDGDGTTHHVRLEPKSEHQAITHEIIGMLGGEAGQMLSEEFQFQSIKQTKNWMNVKDQTGDPRLSDLETKGVDDGFQIRRNKNGRKEPIHYGDVVEKFRENLSEVDYNINHVDQDTRQGLSAMIEKLRQETGGNVNAEEFMTYLELGGELPADNQETKAKNRQIEKFLNNLYTSDRRSELIHVANLLR